MAYKRCALEGVRGDGVSPTDLILGKQVKKVESFIKLGGSSSRWNIIKRAREKLW